MNLKARDMSIQYTVLIVDVSRPGNREQVKLLAKHLPPQEVFYKIVEMSTYVAIGIVCLLYFAIFYYMLQFKDDVYILAYYPIVLFMALFFFLGLGGIEMCIKLCGRKHE